jgi:hypothetical protein
MEKEFIPYTEALALKELGFDEPCFGVYYTKDGDVRKYGSNEIGDAPLYQQAFRWFREKHNLIGKVWQFGVSEEEKSIYEYMIDKLNNLGLGQYIQDFPFSSYEEAELECLKKLIEIVKEKK